MNASKMQRNMFARILTLGSAIFLFVPHAYAHEVYVLSQETIEHSIGSQGFSLWSVLVDHLDEFVFWAFIAALTIAVVFFASVSRSAERVFDPLLAKLPPYAPVVSRLTIGIALCASAYYYALYGPELPLDGVFGAALAPTAAVILSLVGVMFIVGFYTRIAAFIGLVFFAAALAVYGSYMLTYTNYAGELVLLTILGAHRFAFHRKEHDEARAPRPLLALKKALTPYAFPILRVAFGVSLIYASLYAKVIHNNLALAVASTALAGHAASLASVFGFTPEFLVLGAAIIETLIGIFFILGAEIRFTSVFLIFWLSLSLWYFGEIVWPHVILIGIPLAFICYGYDRYSLEGYFFRRGGREPVL